MESEKGKRPAPSPGFDRNLKDAKPNESEKGDAQGLSEKRLAEIRVGPTLSKPDAPGWWAYSCGTLFRSLEILGFQEETGDPILCDRSRTVLPDWKEWWESPYASWARLYAPGEDMPQGEGGVA